MAPRRAILAIVVSTALAGGLASLVAAFALPDHRLWLVPLILVVILLLIVVEWIWRASDATAKAGGQRYAFLPEVQTARLQIRRPRHNDSVWFAATIDDEVMRENGWTDRIRAEQITAIERGFSPYDREQLLITTRSDGAVVGAVAVRLVDEQSRTCELGWHIGPRFRGNGYASEAVAAFVDALHDAGSAEIAIGTAESNTAVRRICAKIGATVTESRPHELADGSTIASVWYRHTRAPIQPKTIESP